MSTPSSANLDLGPCRVYWGSSQTDLGRTQGGVRVAFSTDAADLLSDQYGTQPENQVITGSGATITVPLAEYTLDNLAIALNQAVTALNSKHGIKGDSLVGTRMTSFADELLLKKYVDGSISSDTEDWIKFPSAAPLGNFEVPFDGSSQRIIEVVFRAFPNADDVLYFLGDEDAAESGT